MTMLYPIVLETEERGAVSAYAPGLPVYAAAATHAKAERAIRAVLTQDPNAYPFCQGVPLTGESKTEAIGALSRNAGDGTSARRLPAHPELG